MQTSGLKETLLGVVAGAGTRGVSREEANIITFLIAFGTGKVGEWGFQPSDRGPRSNLVDKLLEELVDQGYLAYSFELRGLQQKYIIIDSQKIAALEQTPEFITGFTVSHTLLIKSRLLLEELQFLAYMLEPRMFMGLLRRKLEEKKVLLAKTLVKKGVIDKELVLKLLGIKPELLEKSLS